MRLRYSHFAACLSLLLLLVLSQWLSLAHATEHLLTPQESWCQVCALQNHQHATAVNTFAIPVSIPHELFNYSLTIPFYPVALHTGFTIRAPPQIPHI